MTALPPPRVALRGASVGLLATAVDLALLALLDDVARLPLAVASPAALLAGVAVQFVGSRAVTFRARAAADPPTVVRVPVTSLVYFGVSWPLWSRVFQPARGAS